MGVSLFYRFVAFLNQERERRIIVAKGARHGSGWGYFTHCATFCVWLAVAICSAPLLYDYMIVYRGSLDGVILACVIGTMIHLLLWLVLWILLTIKQKWVFKLRVTIGRATVRSARSVKLVTDVDLISSRDDDEGASAPLLVVGNGRTYTIADTSPKKAIMSVIQKAAMERKSRNNGDYIFIANYSIVIHYSSIRFYRSIKLIIQRSISERYSVEKNKNCLSIRFGLSQDPIV